MSLISFMKKHCLICDLPIPDQRGLCVQCLQRMKALPPQHTLDFSRIHAVWAYDQLSSHLIHRLKFYEDFTTLPFLVDSLTETLKNAYVDGGFPEVIIPVPLHFSRLFKRGFNQSEELGKLLAKRLSLKIDSRILKKVKPTKAQLSLHVEERAKNLKSAFSLTNTVPYESIAILDDVMTTGATANEIAKLFKAAGVEEIHVWVLARTLKETT